MSARVPRARCAHGALRRVRRGLWGGPGGGVGGFSGGGRRRRFRWDGATLRPTMLFCLLFCFLFTVRPSRRCLSPSRQAQSGMVFARAACQNAPRPSHTGPQWHNFAREQHCLSAPSFWSSRMAFSRTPPSGEVISRIGWCGSGGGGYKGPEGCLAGTANNETYTATC